MVIEQTVIDSGALDPTAFDTSTRISHLEQRLDRGWKLMQRSEERGEPIDELFSHFEVLLREYEDLFDTALARRTA